MKSSPILVISGPTAVGKTATAIAVAEKLNGEIISVDSRQIYRGMARGTAQPSKAELESIPHHLIAVRQPNEPISAGEYAHLVDGIIKNIRRRGKEPILCGGSGLYLEALTKGIFAGSVSNEDIRQQLNKKYEKNPDDLLIKLQEIDPEYSKKVHVNNKKRLVRAMEIFEITGKPPTDHFKNQPMSQSDNQCYCIILLSMNKQDLEGRIRLRTKNMLAHGWIDETKELLEKYKIGKAHALDSIGYKQICMYLSGEMEYKNLENEIVIKTRQYAKRQMTWFNNKLNPHEIDMNTFDNYDSLANEIIGIWKRVIGNGY